MDGAAPLELNRLLRAPDIANREAAWEELIGRHTRLLMTVARSFGGDHDAAMERYSYMLEKLRESEFRRLRAYDPAVGATFSTWLTVAARHLCLDHHRSRFGRTRKEDAPESADSLRAVRRALNGLIESDVPEESNIDSTSSSVDAVAMRGELDACLRMALGRLTPRERLLLSLRFQDELPASRIAGILGLRTQFHVYRNLNTLLKKLRTTLESSGIDGSDG